MSTQDSPALIAPSRTLYVVGLFGDHHIICEWLKEDDRGTVHDVRVYRGDGAVVEAHLAKSAIYGTARAGFTLDDLDRSERYSKFGSEPPFILAAAPVGRWEKEDDDDLPF